MKMSKTIKVYCGTYGKYNAGSIAGEWLNLENYADIDDFLADCAEIHKDESDPEFMFQDIDNDTCYPFSGEPMIADIEKMIEFLQLDNHERRLVEAWLELMDDRVSIQEALDNAEDYYCGDSDDFFDWACYQAEELFYEQKDSPLWNYFDFDKWARDLSFEYVHASNGVIFNR